jgi:hypothetical protein
MTRVWQSGNYVVPIVPASYVVLQHKSLVTAKVSHRDKYSEHFLQLRVVKYAAPTHVSYTLDAVL